MQRMVCFIIVSLLLTLTIILCANALKIQTPGFIGVIATMFVTLTIFTGFNFLFSKLVNRYMQTNFLLIIIILWILGAIAIEVTATFLIWQPTRMEVKMNVSHWAIFILISDVVLLCLSPFIALILVILCHIFPKFDAYLRSKKNS